MASTNNNGKWGITINNPSRVFGEEEVTGRGKKGLREVKVIFFDWKGTLEAVPPNRTTEFRKDRHVRPLAAMLKRGLECCSDEQQQQELRSLLEGVSLEKCWELYSKEKERLSGTTESFSLKTLVQNLLEVLGVKDPSIQTAMYDAYFQVSNANDRILMEGVVELLEKLKASKRYRIALIRNSKQPGDQFSKILRHHNVHHYFEALILGGELGFSKPSSKLFEAALTALDLKELQKLTPERILLIGNETKADIEGGKRMGWTTCLIRSTESSSFGLADFEIDTLHDLEKLLFSPTTNHNLTS